MAVQVQDIIRFLENLHGKKLAENTVDTLKTGHPETEVHGITSSFMSTFEVLKKSVELGHNLIVTHEPTFYDHFDRSDWLPEDPILKKKCEFIEEHQLQIYRYHDGWHMTKPDGILEGMAIALGWEKYLISKDSYIFEIPQITFAELLQKLKDKLQGGFIRKIGPDESPIRRLAFIPGCSLGSVQIESFQKYDLDLVLCGESHEWETCEYVRDAREMGYNLHLAVLGHQPSEEASMEYLATILKDKFYPIPIQHIAAKHPFSV